LDWDRLIPDDSRPDKIASPFGDLDETADGGSRAPPG
jgi:hypothetical protein